MDGVDKQLSEAGLADLGDLEKQAQKELLERRREDTDDGGSAVSVDNKNRTGVLLRLLTAIESEKEYRQALLTASFKDDEEADRAAAAISEAKRFGLSLDPILDWAAARCGVSQHGHGKSRAELGIEGLTHSTFTTQRFGLGKKQRKSDGDVKQGDL